jgi:hypothetical protein
MRKNIEKAKIKKKHQYCYTRGENYCSSDEEVDSNSLCNIFSEFSKLQLHFKQENQFRLLKVQ